MGSKKDKTNKDKDKDNVQNVGNDNVQNVGNDNVQNVGNAEDLENDNDASDSAVHSNLFTGGGFNMHDIEFFTIGGFNMNDFEVPEDKEIRVNLADEGENDDIVEFTLDLPPQTRLNGRVEVLEDEDGTRYLDFRGTIVFPNGVTVYLDDNYDDVVDLRDFAVRHCTKIRLTNSDNVTFDVFYDGGYDRIYLSQEDWQHDNDLGEDCDESEYRMLVNYFDFLKLCQDSDYHKEIADQVYAKIQESKNKKQNEDKKMLGNKHGRDDHDKDGKGGDGGAGINLESAKNKKIKIQ